MKILLKKIRNEKHLTILQLSIKSGVSTAHISLIENEDRMPTIKVMCKLSKALGVSLQDLIDCHLDDD